MFTDTGKPINTHTAARKSKRQKTELVALAITVLR